jgi:hypothetical protein
MVLHATTCKLFRVIFVLKLLKALRREIETEIEKAHNRSKNRFLIWVVQNRRVLELKLTYAILLKLFLHLSILF